MIPRIFYQTFETADLVPGIALSRLGLPRVDPGVLASLLRLEEALPDSAVGALKQQVMEDSQIVQELRTCFATMSDRALSAGCTSLETKLLRLELLTLAVPEKSRGQLIDAIKTDMDRSASRIQKHLQKTPTPRSTPW